MVGINGLHTTLVEYFLVIIDCLLNMFYTLTVSDVPDGGVGPCPATGTGCPGQGNCLAQIGFCGSSKCQSENCQQKTGQGTGTVCVHTEVVDDSDFVEKT